MKFYKNFIKLHSYLIVIFVICLTNCPLEYSNYQGSDLTKVCFSGGEPGYFFLGGGGPI